MTDRELLEMAAKAAGLKLNGWHSWRGVGLAEGPHNYWNPLTDDGDALRLAVKLRIVPQAVDGDMEVRAFTNATATFGGQFIDIYEEHDDDEMAATRRAIVHAAATIGKAMP